jgi:hypothetical protein
LPLLLLALAAVAKPWAARTLQAALFVGAAEWLRTMASFVSARQAEGRPWGAGDSITPRVLKARRVSVPAGFRQKGTPGCPRSFVGDLRRICTCEYR